MSVVQQHLRGLPRDKLSLQREMEQLHIEQLKLRRQSRWFVLPMAQPDLVRVDLCEAFIPAIPNVPLHRCNRPCTYFQQTMNGRVSACELHVLGQSGPTHCPILARM